MSHPVLVVCTADLCRAPVAAGLQRRALDAASGGRSTWVVSSAQTSLVRARLDRSTVATAAAVEVDLSAKVLRHVDSEVLRSVGADLTLTISLACPRRTRTTTFCRGTLHSK